MWFVNMRLDCSTSLVELKLPREFNIRTLKSIRRKKGLPLVLRGSFIVANNPCRYGACRSLKRAFPLPTSFLCGNRAFLTELKTQEHGPAQSESCSSLRRNTFDTPATIAVLQTLRATSFPSH